MSSIESSRYQKIDKEIERVSSKRIWLRILNHPAGRFVGALAGCVAAYLLYNVAVVPRIEGAPIVRRRTAHFPDHPIRRPLDDKSRFAGLFPDDAWEWQPCKTLETDQGTILFQDYTQNDDGTWDVTPFTLVVRTRPGDSLDSLPRQAPLVLRTSVRARLWFNQPLHLGRSETAVAPSRMERAQLIGDVTVSRRDPDDPIWIQTRNVQITAEQIRTLEAVQFQFGPHQGAGRSLTIDLAHRATTQLRRDFSSVDGLRRVQVAYLDFLRLEPRRSDSGVQSNPDLPSPHSSDALLDNSRVPLEITCKGPFVFDYERRRSTFQKQVVARQLIDSGDSLTCDQLDILFTDRPHEPTSGPTGADETTAPPLAVSQIIAVGEHVLLDAPSQTARINGQYLKYDVRDGQVDVRGKDQVQIVQGTSQFVAQQLTYRIPEDHRLGPLDAVGAGYLIRRDPKTGESFSARWSNFLTIRRVARDQHLVSLDGNAQLKLDADTNIQSGSLQIWLWETPRATRNDQPERWQYDPARLVARRDVQLESPDLVGTTDWLETVWPEPTPRPADRPSGLSRLPVRMLNPSSRDHQNVNRWGAASNLSPRRPIAAQTPLTRIAQRRRQVRRVAFEQHLGAAGSHSATEFSTIKGNHSVEQLPFHFRGDRVQVTLGRDRTRTQIAEVELNGNVRVWKIESAQPDANAKPTTEILGDRIHVRPQSEQLNQINVFGSKETGPAILNAQGMRLVGPQATLDQTANRVWITGAGRLDFVPLESASRSATAPSTQPIPNERSEEVRRIQVDWQGGMIFDGQQIYFETDVVSRIDRTTSSPTEDGASTILTTSQALTLTLNRRVNLARSTPSPARRTELQIQELLLIQDVPDDQRAFAAIADPKYVGPVVLESLNRDLAGQIIEHQKLVAPSAVIDVKKNRLDAIGPGAISIHRRTDAGGSPPLAALGLGAKRPHSRTPTAGPLTYIQLMFDSRMVLDGQHRQLESQGNIRAIYTHVDHIQQEWPADSPEPIPDAIRMTCDEIVLTQWKPESQKQPTTELIAVGNAHILASQFEVTAHRVSFDQRTDILTIEGTPRSDANLWTRTDPRKPPNHLVAGKIRYRPSDDWTYVDRVKSATFNGK